MSALAEITAQEGLPLLVFAVLLAGLVRGFTGFGTAMVYLPIAGQVLDPVTALATLILIDFVGPLPAVPRAIRDGHPRDVLRLAAGALAGAPFGVMILLLLPADVFRGLVSVLTLAMLALLVSGLRYRGPVGKPMIYGIGSLAGLLHGAAGLPGPPVILLYMARPLPVQVIRASILLFLLLSDMLMAGIFTLRGLISAQALLLGICLVLPYLAALMIGARIFDPGRAALYRRAAYAIIAVSAVAGLPIWT